MKSLFSDWTEGSGSKRNEHLFHALSQIYISMIVLDLNSHSAVLLSSKYDSEFISQELPWNTLLDYFIEHHVYVEDQDLIRSLFSISSLSLFCDSNVNEKYTEVRFLHNEETPYEWVELSSSVYDSKNRQLLITMKSIREVNIQKRVFNHFLYHQNCDFFVLLDLEDNAYQVFDVRAGLLPVPAMGCVDYMSDMIAYNNQYVVKSDVDRVTSLMEIQSIRRLLQNRDEYSFTSGVLTDSGEYRRAKIQFISFDRTKNLVIVARTDYTQIYMEEKKRNEQLVRALHAAQRDLLTGLYNQSTTEHIVSEILTEHQEGLAAVMFIDVDNFKLVNDTLGHLQGNELLKKMAHFLKSLPSDDLIIGRVGGDEFLLFMRNISAMQQVTDIARQVCGAFSGFRDLIGDLAISCSLGISLYPQDGLNFDILVQKADQALYSAKRHGKNNYYLYSEDLEFSKYYSSLSEID